MSDNVWTHKLELVKWKDSANAEGCWMRISDIQDLDMEILSVGFVVRESEDWIIIVPHYGLPTGEVESQGCGEMHIPKCSIVSRRVINVEVTGGGLR